LFLSGPARVGKSTLAARCLRDLEDDALSVIDPWIREPEVFLRKVLSDLGLEAPGASTGELKNILQVYLQHHSASNRRAVLMVDHLEQIAVPVLRELEWLSGLRFRNRSLMCFVLLTRSEGIVADLMPGDGGEQLPPYVHQRLSGFDLEETRSYLYTCLENVGCEDAERLFSQGVIVDIQAFTRGLVGDIDALCCEALSALAKKPRKGRTSPTLTSALIKLAGKKLHLNYNSSVSDFIGEVLSPESVHQFDTHELTIDAARLFVSSQGRVVAEISLNRPRMVLGRGEDCDISLDSSYVSHYQNLFMETEDGWMLIDLNSTNGCYVNGHRIREHRLQDGDVIAVGHHQISFVAVSSNLPPLRELNTLSSAAAANSSTTERIVGLATRDVLASTG
jgi:pSer/pThr/pTyr-binding forkhead associated (FHA) protein/type II secretory pathway predicted ATPase ExeA